MNKSKGFTIIELLVVIAIIAVLAAIVLINVTGYINKGKDAAAKADMGTLMTNAVNFSQSHSSTFNGMTAAAPNGDGDYRTAKAALEATSMGYTLTATCNGIDATCATAGSDNTAWCAQITLKASANTYCIDSTGNKLEKASGTCSAGVCS